MLSGSKRQGANIRCMRTIGIFALISIAILVALLTNTSPSTISPIGILVVYLVIYTLLLGVVTYFLFFGSRLLAMMVGLFIERTPPKVSSRSAYLYGSVIAIAPVILIAIQSVSAIGITDVALVVLFELMACFYIWRRS